MSYIGFEFEGETLAKQFMALDEGQQDEVRTRVKLLIEDYWNTHGQPAPKDLHSDIKNPAKN